MLSKAFLMRTSILCEVEEVEITIIIIVNEILNCVECETNIFT